MAHWPRAHNGLAVDEVPIIAQRGEGILNRKAMQRIGGPAGLSALNTGGGGAPSAPSGPLVVHSHLYLDGREIAASVDQYQMSAVRRERFLTRSA
jgi:hypothetical protein